MALKTIKIKPTKGISKDFEDATFPFETAYNLKNLKNDTLDNSVFNALVNEKGTLETPYTIYYPSGYAGSEPTIQGDIIGVISCGSNISVIFTKLQSGNNHIDHIYKIIKDDNISGLIVIPMAIGTFNFGELIQGVFSYENSEVLKIYWVDGENTLRYINIAKYDYTVTPGEDANHNITYTITVTLAIITDPFYLSMYPEANYNHTMKVIKQSGGGVFPAGTILYAFTYFFMNGPETAIIDTTPLYYMDNLTRGARSDSTTGLTFKIEIENPDDRFEYIRVYSIQRTSLDGVPIVKIVDDIKLSNS